MGTSVKILLTFVFILISSIHARAGTLLTEYTSDFELHDVLYSAKLAISDFDADGRDDLIITDDVGSFHVFALRDAVFEELWISDPLDISMGTIKWVGAIEGPLRQSRIFLLDSSNTLQRYSYSGYVFGKTGEWHIPIEGSLIDAAIIRPPETEWDEFLRLIILPGFKFVVESFHLGKEAEPALASGIGTKLYALPGFATWSGGTATALMTLRGEEKEDNLNIDYFLDMVTSSGETLASYQLAEFDPKSETISQVSLDTDGSLTALSFGYPDEVGTLEMRLWRETEAGILNTGKWSRFPAHRAIASGDIDGDNQLEFVIVGIDGTVRILGEEKLEFIFDGVSISPTLPSAIEHGEVFQTSDFFGLIDIEIIDTGEQLSFSHAGLELVFRKSDERWLPEEINAPPLDLLTDAYGYTRYPLSRICIGLGFAYRFRSDSNLVEVLS
jgi:hypothetical protein